MKISTTRCINNKVASSHPLNECSYQMITTANYKYSSTSPLLACYCDSINYEDLVGLALLSFIA